MAEEIVTLTIRDGVGHSYPIESSLKPTVLQLKARIEDILPFHPPISSQRLIFAGRLLADTSTIRDALGSMYKGPTMDYVIFVVSSAARPEEKRGAGAEIPAQSPLVDRPILRQAISNPDIDAAQSTHPTLQTSSSMSEADSREMRAEVARRRIAALSSPTASAVSSAEINTPKIPTEPSATSATTNADNINDNKSGSLAGSPQFSSAAAPGVNAVEAPRTPSQASSYSTTIPSSPPALQINASLSNSSVAAASPLLASLLAGQVNAASAWQALGATPGSPTVTTPLTAPAAPSIMTPLVALSPLLGTPLLLPGSVPLMPQVSAFSVGGVSSPLRSSSANSTTQQQHPTSPSAPLTPLLAVVRQRQAEVAAEISILQSAQHALAASSPVAAASIPFSGPSPILGGMPPPLSPAQAALFGVDIPAMQLGGVSPVARARAGSRRDSDVNAGRKPRNIVELPAAAPPQSPQDTAPQLRHRANVRRFDAADEQDEGQQQPADREPAPAMPAQVPAAGPEPGNRVAEPALPQQPDAAAARAGIARFFDFGLVIRLAVLGFIFFHDSNPERLGMAVGGLVIFYLARVGAFEALIRLCCHRRMAEQAGTAGMPGAVLNVYTQAIISGRGNFLMDLSALILSFFVSLWPQWDPEEQLRPHAVAVQAPEPPIVPPVGPDVVPG